jgi:hypothetical protein
VLGGIFGAQGAETAAKGQQLGIQGQILDTIGRIFGLQTQAQQYGYTANINDYQAGVAKVNKQIADSNASYAIETGNVQAELVGEKGKADEATMEAHQASSGISMASKSSAAVRTSMVEIAQYNQDMTRANAAKTAYGYEVEAVQDKAQSGLFTYTADTNRAMAANTTAAMGLAEQAIPLEQQAYGLAGQAGDISATASLLGAAGTVSSQWMKASSLGMFKSV